ncbi:uncharacterized protein [Centroberyx affinis]|uniref:uncharacterized protein n=1 Tax=Centroberyx affinis TaxID=166261 RepID=UPI003A5C0E94
MEAKWRSMVNHVQDIHEHGTPAFPTSAHPPLEGEAEDKQWLEPVSTVAVKLESLATRTALMKDSSPSSALHQSTLGSPSLACTAAYASALMESLRENYSRSPTALQESSAAMSSTAPGPLSRSCQQITKDEAVGLYLALHSWFTTGHQFETQRARNGSWCKPFLFEIISREKVGVFP